MAIVHDYFFNRGVPGSAITIPSAGEPVYYIVFLLRKFYTILLCLSTDFYIFFRFFLGLFKPMQTRFKPLFRLKHSLFFTYIIV